MVRLAGLALTLLIAACSAPIPPSMPNDAIVDDAIVYVVRRDWHTDIGLQVDSIAGPLAAMEKPFPGVRFLIFGFGERQFLVNREENLGAMLRALLPSQSALLVTALSATPEQAFGPHNIVVLHVSRAGLTRVETAIDNELERTRAGEPIRLTEGPYPGSVFYAARDIYNGLFTCNTWTAETLRTGGLPLPATGVLFAGQVMGMARWIRAQQTAPPRAVSP